MAKAKEAKTIKVKNAEGKELVVTEKAFNVVYSGLGYKEVAAKKKDEK